MKDALGHGSNPGTHAQGTQATPQLQRRHFEAIAAELRAQAPKGKAKNFVDPNDPRNPQSNAAWDAFHAKVNATADKLATTNPGFRRDFFVAAATGGKYNFKGPGKNGAAVKRTASKFTGSGAHVTGDGRTHSSAATAIAHANRVFKNTGNVISVVKK